MTNNISNKVKQLKGDMSFQEFSDDVFKKTGVRIHFTTLQKYTQGEREPSKRMLKVLSTYAEKPISWFLGEEDFHSKAIISKETRKQLSEYEDILLEAKKKHIPPESFELFLKAIEIANKNRHED